MLELVTATRYVLPRREEGSLPGLAARVIQRPNWALCAPSTSAYLAEARRSAV